MKTFKMLLLGCAVSLSTMLYANPSEERFADMNSISHEIENILQESHLILDEELEVTIFFSISEDKKIQCINVASGNEDLNYFIQKELENRNVFGGEWREGIIYELSVDYSDTLLAYANL
ncbi:hypothetical protein SAMN04488034_103196 [Salinimicrobium catena]|uniref:Uncharacterized protein n=1 Tax=Salinimicrobium catena TaxID=390640 RepID=A0A1H5N038_9FLAO|nr:hypothetical protein [Salinimicrobium catena]SDL32503.1 hypothetical protein SAMN04488140_103196 [Salinimicrobium catena]SEE94317.1 hypothetical protein SAMN04488034_103196 [Salinimicrobium catena]